MAAEFHDTETGEPEEGSDGRLRSAMLDDGQPSFPWWLPLPGIALTVLWAAFQGASAEEGAGSVFFQALLWPGAAIFVLTTITSYFGWRLDLD